jgi:hypothetical protein
MSPNLLAIIIHVHIYAMLLLAVICKQKIYFSHWSSALFAYKMKDYLTYVT